MVMICHDVEPQIREFKMKQDIDHDQVLAIWRDWGKHHVREDRLEYDIGMIFGSNPGISWTAATYLYHRLREWQRTGR